MNDIGGRAYRTADKLRQKRDDDKYELAPQQMFFA